MITKISQYLALISLFLVTGVFWGNWLAISRSYDAFSVVELSHIAKVAVHNLETPMTFLSMACLFFMGASTLLFPKKKSLEFLMVLLSIVLLITPILITTILEVPINNQVVTWTLKNVPKDWEDIRNKWQIYNNYRVISALISFSLFSFVIIKPLDK